LSDTPLARYADCIFWLARYVERAENLARILDVNETFSCDSRGGQNWRSIVQLNADEERFFATHAAATAASVLDFYIVDGDNPISTEMWVQLNVFYNGVAAIGPEDLAPGRLAPLFATIKEACQTDTGITSVAVVSSGVWQREGPNYARVDTRAVSYKRDARINPPCSGAHRSKDRPEPFGFRRAVAWPNDLAPPVGFGGKH
jgi:uncharacterized alpha-E superfamily protein